MSTNTSANPITIDQISSIPPLRSSQKSNLSIGKVAETVNLFRGSVHLQVPLLVLKNRGGLEAEVTLNYSSDVQRAVRTRNLESPTGILGLGWSLNHQSIVLDIRGSASSAENKYYLAVGNSGSNQLHLKTKANGYWEFEADTYEFENIFYYPDSNIWKIIDVEGITKIFGENDTVRKTVKWGNTDGNWIGSSIETAGQSVIPTGWYLTSIESRWGDKITFEYSDFADDTISIGTNGASYTRAKYLTKITDPAGRVVDFNYEEKLNTSEIKEFEAPHRNPYNSHLNAFQDLYETRYLSSVVLSQILGDNRESVCFTASLQYSLENYSPTGTPGKAASLFKRYLKSVTIVDADGQLTPGWLFEYFDSSSEDNHSGAIKTITYPEGAKASYQYLPHTTETLPNSALSYTQKSGDPDWDQGKPRFWYGSDYCVLARYNDANDNQLTITVFDWNGSWLRSQPLSVHLPYELDLNTLEAVIQDNQFVISGMLTGSSGSGLLNSWIFNRVYGQYGTWESTSLDFKPFSNPQASYQILAGDGFVVGAISGESQILRYIWNPSTKKWLDDSISITTTPQGEWSLGAYNNLLTICQYIPGQQLRLTLHVLDHSSLVWNDNLPALDSIPQFSWQDNYPKPFWSVNNNYASFTYITSIDEVAKSLDYSVKTYLWDQNFSNIQSPAPIVESNVPIKGSGNLLVSVATNCLLGNGGNLRRYNGLNWLQGQISLFSSGQDDGYFAYSDTIAIGVDTQNSQVTVFDPYTETFSNPLPDQGGQGPLQPTICGQYITVRNNIYYVAPDGTFEPLPQLPTSCEIVSNHAPNYLIYNQTNGRSYIQLLQNGAFLGSPVELQGTVFPKDTNTQGNSLSAPTMFTSFQGDSLDDMTEFTLHRVLDQRYEGGIANFSVSSIAVDDGMGGISSAAFDYAVSGSVATSGPYGLVTQFSKVKVVMGSTNTNTTPFGYSIHTYFNGQVPESPSTSDLYTLKNGLIHQVSLFNSKGEIVGDNKYSWQIFQEITKAGDSTSIPLIGSYIRKKSSSVVTYDVNPGPSSQNPLTETTTYKYSTVNGRAKSKSNSNFNNDTQKWDKIDTSFTFGFEKYPQLAESSLHVLAPVVLKTLSINDAVIAIDATTWSKNDNVWASYRKFKARSATSELSDAEWNNQSFPPNQSWQCSYQVILRDSHGEVLEWISKDGISNAVITDKADRFMLARFKNASVQNQQVDFLSFESYEDASAWTLNGSNTNLLKAIRKGQAYIGTQSLLLAKTGQDNAILQRTLNIKNTRARKYVLSCWVKTEPGFKSGIDLASLEVTWPAGGKASTPIPDGNNQWEYVYLLMDLPTSAANQPISVSIINAGSVPYSVDAVRFSPIPADFEGLSYNQELLTVDSTIHGNGRTERTIGEQSKRLVAKSSNNNAVDVIKQIHLSRQAGSATFSDSFPNSELVVQPRTWGCYQNFFHNQIASSGWTSTEMADWSVSSKGGLINKGGSQSTIEFGNYQKTESGFGFHCQVVPTKALSKSFTFQLNKDINLSWSPATGAWTFEDRSSGSKIESGARSILSVSFSEFAVKLNTEAIPSQSLVQLFCDAGLPLSPAGKTSCQQDNLQWQIEDSNLGLVYYLAAQGTSSIAVCVCPADCTVLVQGTTISFFSEGGKIISASIKRPTNPTIAFSAYDQIAFNNVILFSDPQIQLNYQDGSGRTRQEQVNDLDQWIMRGNVFDDIGRKIIHSQTAVITPSTDAWGDYDAALLSLNRQNWAMSGKVATANPESGDYPYWRTRFEDSPLARQVELGKPGASYAIVNPNSDNHTVRLAYGLNDGSLGNVSGTLYRITKTDPDNRVAVQLHDQRKNKLAFAKQVSDGPSPQYQEIQYFYNGLNQRTKVVTPLKFEHSFHYNFLGELESTQRPDENPVSYLYDDVGRKRFEKSSLEIDQLPVIRYWKYDVFSRVVESGVLLQSWPGILASKVNDQQYPTADPTQQFEYDFHALEDNNLFALGRLTKVINTNESYDPRVIDDFLATEMYWYDIKGMITKKSESVSVNPGETYQTTYGFNNLGQLTSVQYPGTGGCLLTYQLDPVGRITRILINQSVMATYCYGDNGCIKDETLFAGSGTQVGSARSFSYAPPGWLTANSGPGFSEEITYAPAGSGMHGYFSGFPSEIKTLARAQNPDIVNVLSYNELGQLLSSKINVEDIAYDYDANGNLKIIGDSTNTYTEATKDRVQSRIDTHSTTSYSYNSAGSIEQRTSSESPAKDLKLVWDVYRQQPLRLDHGTAGNDEITTELRYGHKGKRIWKSTKSSAQTETKLYLWGAGKSPVTEISSSGKRTEYIKSPLGTVIALIDGSPYYLAQDRIGSVRAVLDDAETPSIVAAFDYTPYGKALGSSFGSKPDIISYRFSNRELDESGLYDFRARMYDPELGQFISVDPAHQTVSPYVFLGNNPLVNVDPDGKQFISLLIASIVEAIAAGAEAGADAAAVAGAADAGASAAVAADGTVVVADASVAGEAAGGAAATKSAAMIGEGLGYLGGTVSGIQTITSEHLKGGKAAGVFFGSFFIGGVTGALSGGVGAGIAAAAEGGTAAITALKYLGTTLAEAGIGAGSSAADAKLTGGHVGEAAWQGAVLSGISFTAGTLGGNLVGTGLSRAGMANSLLKKVLAGAGGGMIGASSEVATSSLMNQHTTHETLHNLLTGLSLGAVGGVVPELFEPPEPIEVPNVFDSITNDML